MGDFYSWGLPVGSIAGIRVRLHWLLLAMWGFDLFELLQLGAIPGFGVEHRLGLWAMEVGLLLGHILLHELGHCYAARRVGGSADDILLWPLGGLAFCEAPHRPREQFLVAAGGPLVSLFIVAGSWLLFELYLDDLELASIGRIYRASARHLLVTWSLWILIFNLVPLYPLDGGRMCQAILWGLFERRGDRAHAYLRGSQVTLWLSRLSVLAGLIYAGWTRHWWLALILLWAWRSAEGLALSASADQPYLQAGFGYSDEARERRRRPPSTLARRWRRLFTPAPDEPDSRDSERVDRLLDKVKTLGFGALTDEERRFLEEYSRRR